MQEDWTFDLAEDGSGTVEHRAAPRFRARWQTGFDGLASVEGPCWTDEGADERDAITLHGFEWIDAPPGQDHFEGLMDAAASAIDRWIAQRF